MAKMFSLRMFSGLFALTGVSSAVSIPVVLNAQTSTEDPSKNTQGGGTNQVAIFENLERCRNTTGVQHDEVKFGEVSQDKVCWEISDSSGVSELGNIENQKYTHLFQQLGNRERDHGALYNDFGRNDCPDGHNWIFTDNIEEKEHLGLCDNNNSTSNWLVVENKKEAHPKLRVCDGECFEFKDAGGGKHGNTSKEKGAGREVKFHKGNKN